MASDQKTDIEVETSADTSRRSKRGRKEKYNLRTKTLVTRQETEERLLSPKTPKPKSRPPPLSKYRRKAANSRERGRMQEINVAFENLQTALPMQCLGDISSKNSQLTKITTLRLAVNYIAALRSVLGEKESPEEKASVQSDVQQEESTSGSAAEADVSGDVKPKTNNVGETSGTGVDKSPISAFQVTEKDKGCDNMLNTQLTTNCSDSLGDQGVNDAADIEDTLPTTAGDTMLEETAMETATTEAVESLLAVGSILNDHNFNLPDPPDLARSACGQLFCEADVNNNDYLSYYDRPPPPYPSSRIPLHSSLDARSFALDFNSHTKFATRTVFDGALSDIESTPRSEMTKDSGQIELMDTSESLMSLRYVTGQVNSNMFMYPEVANNIVNNSNTA